jgi:uncharacterized SAM-binding protein YcdF (DUF218 family)
MVNPFKKNKFKTSIFGFLFFILKAGTAFAAWFYSLLYLQMAMTTQHFLNQKNLRSADAILVLGNRAYWNQQVNPCLSGRVDHAINLSKQGLAPTLIMSGGLDKEDQIIEAQVMHDWARFKGFNGSIIQEPRSQSTLENLIFSEKILQSQSVESVIIVTEPYHLWRTQWLVETLNLHRRFKVQYSPAQSECWQKWGYFFKGALREPVARIHNQGRFYFSPSTYP